MRARSNRVDLLRNSICEASNGHWRLIELDVDEGAKLNRMWEVTVKTVGEAVAKNTDKVYQSDDQQVRDTLAGGELCITPQHDTAGTTLIAR